MKHSKLKVAALAIALLTGAGCNADSFDEPKTNDEWKLFCEAPNLKERINDIKDINQRQKAAGTCARTPWHVVEKSPEVTW